MEKDALQKEDTKEVIFFSHFQLSENFIRDDVASCASIAMPAFVSAGGKEVALSSME